MLGMEGGIMPMVGPIGAHSLRSFTLLLFLPGQPLELVRYLPSSPSQILTGHFFKKTNLFGFTEKVVMSLGM